MSWQELAVVALVTITGSVVHGSTGIGLGLVAGPALLSIDSRFVPGPLLLASILVGCRHLMVERHHIDRGTWVRLMMGMPLGVALALVVLLTVDQRTMAVAIGVLVVLAVASLLAGLELPRTPVYEVLGGAGAAFGAVAAALPGPPLVMTLHDSPGPVMRPTIAAANVVMSLATTASLIAIGRFGAAELGLLALLAPAVLVGLYLARFVRPWLDRRVFRPAILCVALAGGLALIIRNA